MGNRWAGLRVLNIKSRYNLGPELGRGGFSVTYLCTDRRTGERFACKSISKENLRSTDDIKDVRREIEIMERLPEHPNIVKLKGTYEDSKAVHIVMELCEGGELFDRIVARGHFTERAAAMLIKTIIEVVQICHNQGVIHRDLKPENFLFGNTRENAPLKVIDFGLSTFFRPGQHFDEKAGTLNYTAPEVLKEKYGPEIDIWSAGVILYILLCGEQPFRAETEEGIEKAIIGGVIDFKREPWPKVSDNAKDLVKRMLNPNPKKRLTAQKVLDHPWLQNANKTPNEKVSQTVRARLQHFSVMNKFKKKALRAIAEHLSVEMADIKEMFENIDINKKVKINFDKLKDGLRKLGHQVFNSDVVKALFKAAGADRNGFLDYGELVSISIHHITIGNDEHLKIAFAHFDKNKSGYIEIEELKSCLFDDFSLNREEAIKAIIREVDTDKDGKISYKEFASMMKAGTDWRKALRLYARARFNIISAKLMKDGLI